MTNSQARSANYQIIRYRTKIVQTVPGEMEIAEFSYRIRFDAAVMKLSDYVRDMHHFNGSRSSTRAHLDVTEAEDITQNVARAEYTCNTGKVVFRNLKLERAEAARS